MRILHKRVYGRVFLWDRYFLFSISTLSPLVYSTVGTLLGGIEMWSKSNGMELNSGKSLYTEREWYTEWIIRYTRMLNAFPSKYYVNDQQLEE